MNSLSTRLVFAFLLLALVAAPVVHGQPSPSEEDERVLHDAGVSSDGPALLAFFHARARNGIEPEKLYHLRDQLVEGGDEERVRAATELLGLGSLALQVLRETANDLDHPNAAVQASRFLPWLEGPASHKLLMAAARVLAQRKPEGAAAALLAYLPYADNAEVVAVANAALAAVAAPAGTADPALLRGLSDRHGIRRAAAVVALCQAVSPEEVPEVRKLLKDRSPKVRLRAAKALAEAKDAEAIPVLIDLLAELPADEQQPVEDLLKELAGEWAPILQFATDDELSRGVRRDAWASWWRRCDGPTLLAVLAKHTLTPEKRRQLQELLTQLGSNDFAVRERAGGQLLALGRLALPSLREALRNRDAEVTRRAKLLIERLETGPEVRLPVAALRLLAVRKPAGAVEALLAYLPFVEDEVREEEVRKSLVVLARRDGQLNESLQRALEDRQPNVRAVAAEALIAGGGAEGRAAVRKVLREDVPSVRLKAALALARAGEREGVSVLIDLLPLLSAEEGGQAEEALHQLAGNTTPSGPEGAADDKKKRRDAWAAWWKINAGRVDLTHLQSTSSLGYTLICDNNRNRVFEIDRHGKQRWTIDKLKLPIDAVVLPGNRVLIAEYQGNRVTDRDFKGNILWQKEIPSPLSVQRLPNGNTFIASDGDKKPNNGMIVEVDRSGKEIYTIKNLPAKILAAYRWPSGPIVCITEDGHCRILDTTGKQLKAFASGQASADTGALDLRSNGRILITRTGADEVVEFDQHGRLVLRLPMPGVCIAGQAPNGHILVPSVKNECVREIDRTGKIVWEYKGTGAFIRARRR
jgi:HEAT repeat protein